VPKTLIFAKDDNHAENIVEIVREEFGKGNEFAQKITYRTTGATPKELIKAFRTSYHPRIAVTVDMIATGTDIKPVEIVFFMRAVKSPRLLRADERPRRARHQARRPAKRHPRRHGQGPLRHRRRRRRVRAGQDRRPPHGEKAQRQLRALLQAVAFGNTENDVITSIAGRLARMEHRISAEDDARIRVASGGLGLKDLAHQLVESLNPDAALLPSPSGRGAGGEGASAQARITAAKPLCDPALRQLILDIKAKNELTIDHVSQDQVIEAGFSQAALDRARGLVQSFEQFIADHKDEITALQILYAKPYKQRLTFEAVKELADAIEKPPYLWNESQLWQAYAALEKASKVKGASGRASSPTWSRWSATPSIRTTNSSRSPSGSTPTSRHGLQGRKSQASNSIRTNGAGWK
jgi:type I restriction enzyme, R subunit